MLFIGKLLKIRKWASSDDRQSTMEFAVNTCTVVENI